MQENNTVRELHADAVARHEASQLPYSRIFSADNTLAIHVVKESDAEEAARSAAAAARFEEVFGRQMRDDDPAFWDPDFTDEPRPTPEREMADAQAVALGNAALRSGDASLAVQTLTIRTCGGLVLTDENLHEHSIEEVEQWVAVRDAIQRRVAGDVALLSAVTEYVYVADVLKAGIHRFAKIPTPDRIALLRSSYRQVVNDFGVTGTAYAQNVIYSWLFLHQVTSGTEAPEVWARAVDAIESIYDAEEAERIRNTWATMTLGGEFAGEPPAGGRDVIGGMLFCASLMIGLDPEQSSPLEVALNTGNFLDAAFTLAEASRA